MNEPVEARLELDERAEIGDAGYCSVNAIASVIFLGGADPGVRLKLFEAERDAFLAGVDFEDLNVELLTNGEDVGGLVYTAVRDIRDVQHAIDAADIDKGAVIEQTA